jgi:23S rRNA (adenine2503-C2)-methyltransferase
MALALRRRGVLTTLRQSAGQDVDAGCGQLRSRVLRGPVIPLVAQAASVLPNV